MLESVSYAISITDHVHIVIDLGDFDYSYADMDLLGSMFRRIVFSFFLKQIKFPMDNLSITLRLNKNRHVLVLL